VHGRKNQKDFIAVAYRLRRNHPNCVLQFRAQIAELLDPKKNPFFDHGTIRLFVARRNGQVVGRVAAIVNPISDTTFNEKALHFGFFECEDDPEISNALFAQIEAVGREMGVDCVRGPYNPTVHDELGLQISGFDTPNFVMIPGNPAYYPSLVEQAGYEKCVDLHCFRLRPDEFEDRLINYAAKRKSSLGVKVRQMSKESLKSDAAKIKHIYCEEWVDNWPWIAITTREWDHLVANLVQIADFRGAFVVEDNNGDIIGFSLALPDINEVLKSVRSGRLFPLGLFRLLWALKRRSFTRYRVITMGVVNKWQNKSIDILMHVEHILLSRILGVETVELSQVLDTNYSMMRLADRVGARSVMTHRLYEKKMNGAVSVYENSSHGIS
jgi:hypothetical protein